MYELYLGRMLLPVTPEKISTSIRNNNQTITLIDSGEINILKDAGLTEIGFTALIPQVKYPFARYEGGGFTPASEYLNYFERLKTAKEPFRFILSRSMPDGKKLFSTSMSVSLEEYSIQEEARNGFDLSVDIRLKQWKDYGTKIIEIGTEIPRTPVAVEEERPVVKNPSSSGSGSKKKKQEAAEKSTYAKAVADATAKIGSKKEAVADVLAKVGRTQTSTGGTGGGTKVQLMLTR